MKHYHYIFSGSGMAALMTVYKMAISGQFTDKHILLIDPDDKKTNDRTWCFWQKGGTIWDSVIFRSWETAKFKSADKSVYLDFDGYRYNMVRGIDFYIFVLAELKKHPNIKIVHERVLRFNDTGHNVFVKTDTDSYTCSKLFNSIYNADLPRQSKYPLLLQHFIGWHIKTVEPAFNPGIPVFMDFSIPQNGNTRFIYILPFSETEAIVEYTLFSKDTLEENEYENGIKEYLNRKAIRDYEIIATEKGCIPMTVYPFYKHNTASILNIGSAGGWTKASTGYTFRNSDKQSDRLIGFLHTGHDFTMFYRNNRFSFYDRLLVDILYRHNELGAGIFTALFSDGKAAPVFKFLDEETSPAEELKVILKCPKRPFLAALWRAATGQKF